MANGNNSPWTDELREQARSLYIDQNMSAAAVGLQLGVSRNAVIGKINRMGFRKGIPRPLKDKKAQRKIYKRARTAAGRVERRAEGPTPVLIHGEDIPPLLASVMELESSLCAYPYGNHSFQFCGRPRSYGSFCAAHGLLCYNEPQRQFPLVHRPR